MRQSIQTNSEAETVALGEELARRLSPGSVVAFFGDLGTGKTHFIKGVCKGLGVVEHVASPTFTILNEYRGRMLNVYHFDFYRIESPLEAREIGLQEYLRGDGVCLIEWADRIRELLPPERIDVHLQLGSQPDARTMTIEEIAGVTA